MFAPLSLDLGLHLLAHTYPAKNQNRQLKDMEAKIVGCKEAFSKEVALLKSQLEEEWEAGRRDKEERRKITKKVREIVTYTGERSRTSDVIWMEEKLKRVLGIGETRGSANLVVSLFPLDVETN